MAGIKIRRLPRKQSAVKYNLNEFLVRTIIRSRNRFQPNTAIISNEYPSNLVINTWLHIVVTNVTFEAGALETRSG